VLNNNPVSVTEAVEPTQTDATVTVPKVGCGFTVMAVVLVAVQPLASVTVTLNVSVVCTPPTDSVALVMLVLPPVVLVE